MPRPERPQSYYDEIKQKFREERNLRLDFRPPGTQQYTSEFTGDLAKYAVDPFAGEVPARDPIADEVEVLFIGGGFSALLTSARLREKGIESIRIVEKGADVGRARHRLTRAGWRSSRYRRRASPDRTPCP